MIQKDLMPYWARTNKVTWLDLNSQCRQNGFPDLLPDIMAINNSLFNLFSCPIGERGRIFQPTYGTFLWSLIHEPLDEISARAVRASLIQSIEKWEPRIQLDYSNTSVTPDYNRVGYLVKVTYFYKLNNSKQTTKFFAAQ